MAGCAVDVTWNAPAGDVESYEIVAMPTRTLHKTNATSIEIKGLESGAKYSFDVTAVDADGKSAPVSTEPVSVPTAKIAGTWSFSSWAATAALFVAAIVSVVFWARSPDDAAHIWRSLGLAFSVLLIGALALTLIDKDYGIWRAIVGMDRRVSTSQLQTFLWTVLVGFILVYFSGRTWFDHLPGLFDGFVPGTTTDAAPAWDDYLILLGGPFAALVAARGILTAKIQSGVVQKSIAADGSASVAQAVTNDAGKIDLVDTQYLLFNIVALGYVIIGFASTDRLPAIPSLLLALTGSSAAAYVLNKSVQNNAPSITSVTPSTVRPGETVIVSGVNFRPAGVAGPPTVSVGGVLAIVEADGTDTRLVAHLPPSLAPGVRDVVVTSAIRVSTDPVVITVLVDKPVVLGVTPPVVAVGETLTIEGTGFASSEDGSPNVSVLFGAVPSLAQVTNAPSGLQRIEVAVPVGISSNTEIELRVRTPRLTESEPVKMTFA
jgi:hypothetical protein